MLQQLNAARVAARSCGAKQMKAAQPLNWNKALAEAAELHSVDMAAHDYFEHVNPQGKRVGQRVSAQGYKWKTVGENLAAGDGSVSRVLAGWLKSPDHCANMMNPAYADVGVACVRQPGTKWENYWTMVLATGADPVSRRPRPPATGHARGPAPAASAAGRAAAPP